MKGEKANHWKLQAAKFDCQKRWEDDDLRRPGIYAIVNRRNGNCYIGQSVNLLIRRKSHFRLLQRGKHHNAHLQNAYNYYGGAWFGFQVLEFCDECELCEREQYWIDRTGGDYNIVRDVTNISSRRTDESEPMYVKDGETFSRPAWHRFVYGGGRNPGT